MMNNVDEKELRKAIIQLFDEGDTFEVRIIGKNKKPLTGYFRNADALMEAFKKVDLRNVNVYVTLQRIKDELFSRIQHEKFVAGATSTSDNDVAGYKWLFIDLDPVRATDISSSKEELQKAYDLAGRIYQFLRNKGFEEPVKALSGNGAHLLYRIQLSNTTENAELVEKCLRALSMLFDDDDIKVDVKNFNPSRVCKLYGTRAQKGSSTAERPHRMAKLFGEVKDCQVTKRAYLEELVKELPKEEPRPNTYNRYNGGQFDIEEWMGRHGLTYKAKEFHGGTKYVLDKCPFDDSHTAPDSMITKSANGAIGFRCLHNSCADKHWKDVRLLFEPDAYEYNDADKRIEEGWQRHNRDKDYVIVGELTEGLHDGEVENEEPMFLTTSMIFNREVPDPEYIKTGINSIDKKLNGLEKGKITVMSGSRASGKSTILGQIILNARQQEHNVVCYSGELSDKSFLNWIGLQAAGKQNVIKSAKYEGQYYVPKKTEEKISAWLDNHLWLFNNRRMVKLKEFVNAIQDEALKQKADLIVIDNLMALDVSQMNRSNEYDSQTRFMWAIKRMAEKTNAHVILVAHPRKPMGFLRLEDISGTGNIGNVADNVFIVHRNNVDFKNTSENYLKAVGMEHIIKNESHVTNIIEIAKDREHGTVDEFVCLYYEKESKRLKNYEAENVVYSWNADEDGFEPAEQMEIPFDVEG